MKRTLVCSTTLAASLLLGLPGCGGGGGEKAAPTATTAPTPGQAAPAVTTTTVAGAAAEDEEAAPLLAWADASPEEGKAPQDRFICVEHHDVPSARAILQGRKVDRTRGEVGWGGSEPPSGTAGG